MLRKGTHNSATGFKPKGLLSWLGTPFAKCQSKTIIEQYEAGVRYFDLRLKKVKGRYHFAHGLYVCSADVMTVLNDLNDVSEIKPGDNDYLPTYVNVTYEGSLTPDEEKKFLFDVMDMFQWLTHLNVISINVKKPKWHTIWTYQGVALDNGYLNLDGHSWHTYLPIPWLWDKLYGDHEYNENRFKVVDFI